jgi:hypothetical protein
MSAQLTVLSFIAVLAIVAGALEVGPITDRSAITKFLQTELASIATAHNSIHMQLREKRIPIGDQPRSLRSTTTDDDKRHGKLMVTLSHELNNIECRVALERAPLGSKCIAPCGCTGSQQWIQFAVLNRMRRSEPSQWTVCQVMLSRPLVIHHFNSNVVIRRFFNAKYCLSPSNSDWIQCVDVPTKVRLQQLHNPRW